MNGDQAVREVQQLLSWRSDKATEILLALNFAQDERESAGRTLPWFLLTTTPISIVAGTQAYSLPSDFIKEEEYDKLSFYTTLSTGRPVPMRKGLWLPNDNFFNGRFVNELTSPATADQLATGRPRRYALKDGNVVFWPVPDQSYSGFVHYFAHATDITNTAVANSWLTYAPWVIIGMAGAKLAADLGNPDSLATAQSLAKMGEQNLMGAIVERDLAGGAIAMGSRL